MNSAGRFRFPLEIVLKVKSLREEQARLEVARAAALLAQSRRSLRDTQARWRQLLAELTGVSGKEWPAEDFQLLKDYLAHLQSAISGWQERIKQQEADLAQKKSHLHTLYQERRLLENLRRQKYRQYTREVARSWEKEIEAIALSRSLTNHEQ